MRVLLTFENFASFAGTETYTLTVAEDLERLGHDVVIYSPTQGAMAEHARQQGVRVAWNEEMGEVNRDLVTAHHSSREHAIELVSLARTLA